MTEKQREYKAKWRENHREQIREYDKAWRKAHPEECKNYAVKYWTKKIAQISSEEDLFTN